MEIRDERETPSRVGFAVAASLLVWAIAPVFAAAREGGGSEIRYEPLAIVSAWGAPLVPARIGRLRVRENRFSGSYREIEIAFVRIPSTSRTPGAPIVWLSGGPGWSGISDLDTPALRLFLELRQLGEVIVLDQRGTGLSVPRLDCPGFFQFPYDAPLESARALDGLEVASRACADRWRQQGVDLGAYGARDTAEDLEDLRLAIGAPKLRLLAGSYGTHVALAAIRAHEDSFERAVLLGTVGPDQLRHSPADSESALASIARLMGKEAGRVGNAGDLLGTIRRVRDGLVRHPASVELSTKDGGRVAVVVGAYELAWFTRSLLSSRETIAHLPAAFAAMDAGDFRELAHVAARWRSSPPPPATVFTARCASGVSRDRAARIERERDGTILGEAADFAEDRICRAFGVAPLPDGHRSSVRASIPALFVSGTLDSDTPESNAEEVLSGFPLGEHLRVEGAAHALLGFEEGSTRQAIVRFLSGKTLSATRLALPPLAFERSDTGLYASAPLAANGGRALPLATPFGGSH